MQQGQGELLEIYLDTGKSGRIACPPRLIPAAGQYLHAHADGSDSPLPAPVFSAGPSVGGFLAAHPLPESWLPGGRLSLRGPLGRGFSLPVSARRVALAALEGTPSRLLALLTPALAQEASIVLACETPPQDLPLQVEIQPLAALAEVRAWADYMALDLPRESLPGLRKRLGLGEQTKVPFEAQVLLSTPMPCGGAAECGVCAVTLRRGWKTACKHGPVFDLKELP